MASSWTAEGAAPGNGSVGGGPGAIVGASAIIEGSRGLGSGGALGSRERLVGLAQLALQGRQLGPQSGPALVGRLGQIVVDRRPFSRAQSASNRRQTASIRRARSMSTPPRLWLGRSLILIRSLVQGPSAAPHLKWPAEAKRRRLTSRKMSVSRATVTSRSRFGSSRVRGCSSLH